MRSSILLYLIYYFSYPKENTITHTYFHPIRDVVRTIVNLSDARNIKGIHYEFLQAHWKYTSILCLSLSFAPVCNVLVHMKGQEMWWGHSNSVLRCVWRIRASWMCFNFNIIKTSLYKNIYKNKIGVQMQFLFAWLAGTDSSILRQKKIYQIMCRHEEKKKRVAAKINSTEVKYSKNTKIIRQIDHPHTQTRSHAHIRYTWCMSPTIRLFLS